MSYVNGRHFIFYLICSVNLLTGYNAYDFKNVPSNRISGYTSYAAIDFLNNYFQRLYEQQLISGPIIFETGDLIAASATEETSNPIYLLRFKSNTKVKCIEHQDGMCEKICEVMIYQSPRIQLLSRKPTCKEQFVNWEIAPAGRSLDDECTANCDFMDDLDNEILKLKIRDFCGVPSTLYYECSSKCGIIDYLLQYLIRIRQREKCHPLM